MNGYVCFYKSWRIEVKAETSYEAQTKAVAEFQKGLRPKVKPHMVSVTLAERGGECVIHGPDILG